MDNFQHAMRIWRSCCNIHMRPYLVIKNSKCVILSLQQRDEFVQNMGFHSLSVNIESHSHVNPPLCIYNSTEIIGRGGGGRATQSAISTLFC